MHCRLTIKPVGRRKIQSRYVRSALSHPIRSLQERLAVRLLARTRNVASTEAGDRLIRSIAPPFDRFPPSHEFSLELHA